MFSWLNKLFAKQDTLGASSGWAPKHRTIYEYFDGEKQVKADPIVVFKRIMSVAPELSNSITVSVSPSKDAATAHDDALVHVRKVFGIKAFSDGGLTDVESFELLDDFMAWCDRLKKNTRTGPT